jgi:hypothetical protein
VIYLLNADYFTGMILPATAVRSVRADPAAKVDPEARVRSSDLSN